MSDSLRPHGLYSLPGSSIHGIFQEYWSGLPCYQRPLKVIGHMIPFSSVQLLSRVQLFVTPWTAAHQASLSIMTPRAYSTPVPRVGDAIQPSHPLSSPSSPTFNLSQHQGVFFPMSQFFASDGQRTGVSASAYVLPVNIQDSFALGCTSWISL